jgi:hypothetical protein
VPRTNKPRKTRSDAGVPRPQKVRSFREDVETKTGFVACWNCRSCGSSMRQVVTPGEIARCQCGQDYNVSIVNTTVRIAPVGVTT